MLQVRLLGELEVERDDRLIAAPASRRAWELLAWLALNPGEHPRSAVAARFWPDVLDSSARASLRSAAWALRRALGDEQGDVLVAGRDRIGLRCATDLAAFEAHLAAGEHEAAVALRRGPLLAGFDEDWVLEARDAHDERVGAALARLAATASTPQDAVAWARRRLALDPLDEQAARELMRRLVDAGDRAG
ncbi:MAG TPA: BTAD domain-containing putative transcriptional regulator, partial [Solirubrobacteraceae bacterium]